MHAKNLILDDCSERDVIEKIGEHCPDIFTAKFFDTFIIEAVNLGDSSGFMVSTGKSNSFRISNFETD